jgi:hypothetical protein
MEGGRKEQQREGDEGLLKSNRKAKNNRKIHVFLDELTEPSFPVFFHQLLQNLLSYPSIQSAGGIGNLYEDYPQG